MNQKQNMKQTESLPPSRRTAILGTIIRDNLSRVMVSSSGLVLSAVLDGISILSLLPLLAITMGEESSDQNGIVARFQEAVEWMGLNPSIEVFLVLLVCIISLKTAINMAVMLHISYTQADLIRESRLLLLRNFLFARWEYFVSQAAGKLANAISREAQQAGRLYSAVCNIISSLFQTLIYIVSALLISWQVTLGAASVGLVMLVLLSGLIERSRLASRHQTDLMASFSSHLIDSLQGIKTLKAMGIVGRLESLLSDDIRGMRNVFARMTFLKRSLTSIQELIRVISVAVTLYLIIRYTDQSIAVLAVVAVLFIRTLDAIGRLQKEWQIIAVCSVPHQHVSEIVAVAKAEREAPGGKLKPTLEIGIGIENVSFAYHSEAVFNDLDMFIAAEKFTCMLGPSGAGKTTLLDLVIGLITPQRGKVTIDGVPLKKIDREAWRQSIGYVPQEIVLFHDTLLRNITLDDPSLSREDAERALRNAGAWEFVAALPDGIDTVVGERGGRLSGGQRQRVSIARALVRHPQLLILDEASSALDTETESEIANTLGGLKSGMTILAITHRPTLVKHADVVYFLKDGKLVRDLEGFGGASKPSQLAKAEE